MNLQLLNSWDTDCWSYVPLVEHQNLYGQRLIHNNVLKSDEQEDLGDLVQPLFTAFKRVNEK